MKEELFCRICGEKLLGNQRFYCSNACKQKNHYEQHIKGNTIHSQDRRGITRKLELLNRAKNKCSICGYNKNIAALEFHHLDPSLKEFSLDKRILSNHSMTKIEEEFKKCIVLCANCHRELHNPESTFESVLNSKEATSPQLQKNTVKSTIEYKYKCPICGEAFKAVTGKIFCSEACKNKSKGYPSIEEVNESYKLLGT